MWNLQNTIILLKAILSSTHYGDNGSADIEKNVVDGKQETTIFRFLGRLLLTLSYVTHCSSHFYAVMHCSRHSIPLPVTASCIRILTSVISHPCVITHRTTCVE